MATKTKRKGKAGTDAYMALIRRLPLRPIRNDVEHGRAVEIIEELIGRPLDGGSSDYLDTLILLVNKYEDDHHAPRGLGLSPQEAFKAIMEVNKLTQADMGKIVGSESAVSMFLKGQRGLSKAHIRALVERFGVDAGIFM